MNEEIKEILYLLKRCDNTYLKIENSNGEKEYEYHQVNDLRLDGYHSQLLLDYITNLQQQTEEYQKALDETMSEKMDLQQENERLKEENKRIFSKVNDDELLISNAMNYAEAQDYKSRCEKATEYIKQLEEDYTDYDGEVIIGEIGSHCKDNLLNILKGVDE